jgi:hypothetical protein
VRFLHPLNECIYNTPSQIVIVQYEWLQRVGLTYLGWDRTWELVGFCRECCNGSTGRGPLNMFSARDMDRTLALFRIQSGIWPESPSTKNVAIASKSASSSGIEPVKALKDRFMSVSFLQLLSSFGMLPLSPAPLQTAELDCPAHRCWQFSIEVVLWYIKFLQTFETTNWPRDGACELASGELKNF